ncbi:tripartite motif-containing protein 60-like [Lithobates pipiens]
MASAGMQENLTCSICLSIYTDPVTLNCGHNFCRGCISTDLDNKKENGEDDSCPRCRKRFRDRPELQKNTDLSNIAEKVKSSAVLENRKCSKHNRIPELYCTKDSTFICLPCMVEGEHGGHKLEMLEVASEKKKKKLRDDLQIVKAEREKMERRVQDLHQHKRMTEQHAAELEKKVTTLFMEIRKRVDDLENRVRSQLSGQAELKSISSLIQEMELKISKLTRKIGHLEELKTADPITLLEDQESDKDTEEDTWRPQYVTCELDTFVLSRMLQKGISDIEKVRNTLFPVLPHSTHITLNTKTAGDYVEISDKQKIAKSTDVKKKRRNTADSFLNGVVVSTRMFSSGQHYWVVEGSKSGNWMVGMCYPSMRKEWGRIGENGESWAIEWSGNSYEVKHNCQTKSMHHQISSNRVLVYLDYEAGRLSFYEPSNPLNLLHTFTTKFTEPLHAALLVKKNTEHSQIRVF